MMRYYSSTAVAMALTGPVDSVTTTVPVDTVAGLPVSTPFTVVLDADGTSEEIVTVTAVTGNTLTVTRGQDGTPAQPHTTGSPVRHMVTARDFRESREHEQDTSAHGATTPLVGEDDVQTLTNKTISGAENTILAVPQSAIVNLTTDLAALDADKADAVHTHGMSDVVSGILPITQGGTGATTAAGARTALDAALSSHGHALTGSEITGTLAVAKGGTGATTASAARNNLGAAAQWPSRSARYFTSRRTGSGSFAASTWAPIHAASLGTSSPAGLYLVTFRLALSSSTTAIAYLRGKAGGSTITGDEPFSTDSNIHSTSVTVPYVHSGGVVEFALEGQVSAGTGTAPAGSRITAVWVGE